ncbi:MAG: Fe-S cluster assembly protein SufD [Candidatus Hydrogenedentes bacterium]|nr:Fe-S cluster assembly protein SufD [Candidatus Hydrogenedentota bacterium]
MPDVIEQTDRVQYREDLERVLALDAPAWLRELRTDAAARFDALAFPHYKEEAWRSTNIAPILSTPFRAAAKPLPGVVTESQVDPYLYDEDAWTQLVFVNGFYVEELSRRGASQKGVQVGSLAEAIREGNPRVEERLDHLAEQTSAFIALNSASFRDGAFIEIAKNTVLDAPIHLLYLSTSEHASVAYPRNLVIVGQSAQATLVETFAGLSGTERYLNNVVSEIVLEDNARLERYKMVGEADTGYHLATDQIVLGRDAYLNHFVITIAGDIVRNELRVLLNGEGAECSLNGLYLNDGDRTIDNALNVEHAKSRCRSRMAYKGVLDDTSAAVFTGKVFVEPNAQQTDSDQLNNNLLLSDKATLDTRPQLEIFADDVKCTHGATIGSFPSELIFYFQSRGIDAKQAHGILTYGFAEQIVDMIKVEALRKQLARHVFNKYSKI